LRVDVKAGTKAVMGLMTDYTTPASTLLLGNIIKTYTTLGFIKTRCGYKCTDNSAWYDHGYEAALAFESEAFNGIVTFNSLGFMTCIYFIVLMIASPYNDKVNSDGSPLDTLETVNATHVTEFAKSTLAFVVELSLAKKNATGTVTPCPPKNRFRINRRGNGNPSDC
jgi:hypothetical protein